MKKGQSKNFQHKSNVVHFLILARRFFWSILEPFDYISRILNGKTHLPPLALRGQIGPLSEIENSGAEFLAYMKLLCNMPSDARVLDIGCGFGLMALYLRDYLRSHGSYTGVDVDRRLINWAQKNIGKRRPNFRFFHLDINNDLYNPSGKYYAENVRFPFDKNCFDLILLKSVFTHMRPKEVTNYISEVARLLSSKGVCLATFFLLNERQEELRAKGLNAIDFRFGEDYWRYANQYVPEIAVAFHEREVLRIIQDTRLKASRICYGTWSGREDGLSYQDIMIITARVQKANKAPL